MKKLYLHIGTGKTGSTSIQKTLKNINSDAFFFYYWKDQSNFILNYKTILKNILNMDKKIFILSCEWLCTLNDKVLLQELNELSKGFDTKIIIYIRRQDEFAVSTYQQMTRRFNNKRKLYGSGSLPATFRNSEYLQTQCNYFKICNDWGNIFRKEKIIIRVFSKELLSDGDVVKDFARVVGITLSDNDLIFTNKSIGKIEFKLAHILKKLRVSESLYKDLVFNAPKSRKVLPDRNTAIKFYQKYIESNQNLKNEFQIESVYDAIFPDNFSKYPSLRTDQWDKKSALITMRYLYKKLIKEKFKTKK